MNKTERETLCSSRTYMLMREIDKKKNLKTKTDSALVNDNC